MDDDDFLCPTCRSGPMITDYCPTCSRIEGLSHEAFYRAAFNAGLEAAAKVCEKERIKFGGFHMPSHAVGASTCMDAIRALEKK